MVTRRPQTPATQKATLAISLFLRSFFAKLDRPLLLFHSWFLLALGFALLLGYSVIAKLYFFTAPFRGVVLAAALYLLGIIVNLAHLKFR
jgi:hypothetical protein